jgi:hypothetical protein
MADPNKFLSTDRAAVRALRRWASDPPAAPAPVCSKILLVTSIDFLHRRASDNTILPDISEKILEQLEAQYDQTIVLRVVDGNSAAYTLPMRPNLLICDIDKSSVFESMRRAVLLLKQQCQIEVKMPRDARRLSWLNIGEHISDDRVRVVGGNDYEKAGVEQDKDLSFNDLAKIRSKKSWI